MSKVSGTGHRPKQLGNTLPPALWKPGIQVAFNYLVFLIKQGPADGVMKVGVGGAPGWDMMLGAAALQLQDKGHLVDLVFYEPWNHFELWGGHLRDYKGDSKALETYQKWYEKMTFRASEHKTLFEGQPKNTDHAKQLLWERNVALIDHVDEPGGIMLTCYDGFSKGGTYNTLKETFDKRPRVSIVNLYEDVGVRMGFIQSDARGTPIVKYKHVYDFSRWAEDAKDATVMSDYPKLSTGIQPDGDNSVDNRPTEQMTMFGTQPQEVAKVFKGRVVEYGAD